MPPLATPWPCASARTRSGIPGPRGPLVGIQPRQGGDRKEQFVREGRARSRSDPAGAIFGDRTLLDFPRFLEQPASDASRPAVG
jgi:hypothetical protein